MERTMVPKFIIDTPHTAHKSLTNSVGFNAGKMGFQNCIFCGFNPYRTNVENRVSS